MRLFMFAIAMSLAICGTLVFMAGNQTELLSHNLARLIGTGLFMFSGLFWALYGMSFRGSSENMEGGKGK